MMYPARVAGWRGAAGAWLATALVYFLVGKLSLSLATVGELVSPFWPAAGVAMALMWRFGLRLWPGVLLGAAAVNLSSSLPLLQSLVTGIGNSLAPLIAVLLLKHFQVSSTPLAHRRGVLVFVLGAGTLAPLISSAIGALAVHSAGLHGGAPLAVVWATWWFGDSMGMLLGAPLLLVWQQPLLRRSRHPVAEATILVVAAMALFWLIFRQSQQPEAAHLPTVFLAFPLLGWAITRFGTHAAVFASLCIVAFGTWRTYGGLGPFGMHGELVRVLLLELYGVIGIGSTYALAAVIADRHHAHDALRRLGWDLESRVEERTRELTAANARLERAVRERELAVERSRRLVGILDATTDFVGMANARWEPIYINPAGRRLLGVSDEQLAGSHVSQFHPQWVLDKLFGEVKQTLERAGVWRGELALLSVDGREIPTSQVVLAHRGADGSIEFYSTIARDITADKLLEDELRLAASVFEDGQEGIMITDARGVILRVNQAFSDITGYLPEEAVGQTPRILKSDRHDELFFRALWASIEVAGLWQGEIWNRRRNGEAYPVWCTISAVTGADGRPTHYIGMFNDISEQKHSEERIYRLAHYDVLTDLPNRRLLQEHLTQALNQARRHEGRVGVLFIDLDQFKIVNDSMGHAAGDALLQSAAGRITGCLRASDVVARWGGDEFAVILPDVEDAQGAAAAAQKILETFAAPIEVRGREIFISASIGVSVAPEDGHDASSLLRNADMAMYRAKAKGRNNFQFFTEEMNANLMERLALESALRSAIQQDQLYLEYQPQVDARSGRIVAAEALVRWQHPERGLIPPGKFIPLAEETGQIVAINYWVLRRACEQHVSWAAAGLPAARVAVNLSGRCFQDPKLLPSVAAILEETGIDPAQLELELTETFLVENPEDAVKILDALKSLGIQIAIDDFGIGYSSLSYLKRFALDRLKIDQSFVRDLPADKDDAAIVTTIIAMGKHLGLKVTGEGVESAEQLAFLQGQGCDEVQGYYFSRPVDAEALAKLLLAPPMLKVG